MILVSEPLIYDFLDAISVILKFIFIIQPSSYSPCIINSVDYAKTKKNSLVGPLLFIFSESLQ